jgi:hypothetical protein
MQAQPGGADAAAEAARLTFWSRAGEGPDDPALAESGPTPLAFDADADEQHHRFYAGRLDVPRDGTLVLELVSPRPLGCGSTGRPCSTKACTGARSSARSGRR